MNLEFPKVVAAAQNAKSATWKLADAVLAALPATEKTPLVSIGIYERMAAELKKHVDREYSIDRLRVLANVAKAFPPNKRKPGDTVEICFEARTPETLSAITKAAKASDKDRQITKRLVRRVVQSHAKRHADVPFKQRPPIVEREVDHYFVSADIMGDLAGALIKIREINKKLTPKVVAELSDAMIGGYSEDCERGIKLFQEIRAKLRQGSKSAHLTVVA